MNKQIGSMWILVCMLIITPLSVSAGLRDRVCVVDSSTDKTTAASYEELASWLVASGLEKLAERVRRWEGNGFGSGFIVTQDSGRKLIVTNYHVVSNVNTVTLKFIDGNGNAKEYPDCRIIATSGTKDLALIELPGKLQSEKGLPLADTVPEDGTEVWSAGYPGLGSAPSWQLGRGTITNKKAKIKGLGVSDVDFVIQHSAIIGHGNSGGPLLTKASDTYTVIGVNTWSVLGRDNTYFAIPSQYIRKLLAEYPQHVFSQQELRTMLKDSCLSFEKIMKTADSSYIKYMDLFSNYLIFKYGSDSSIHHMMSLDKSKDTRKLNTFYDILYTSPFTGMGEAVFDRIKGEYGKTDLKFLGISPDTAPLNGDSEIVTSFNVGGKTMNIAWRFQYNRWRISDIILEDLTKVRIQKKEKERDSSFLRKEQYWTGVSLMGGVSLGLAGPSEEYKWEMKPAADLFLAAKMFESLNPFMGYHIGLSFIKTNFVVTDSRFTDPLEHPEYMFATLSADLRIHLPMNLSNGNKHFYITPYLAAGAAVGADIGIFVTEESSGSEGSLVIPLTASAGIELSGSRSMVYGLDITYYMFGKTPILASIPGDYFSSDDKIGLNVLVLSGTLSFYSF